MRADRRQPEPAGLQGPDAFQLLEVLGAEAAGAPAALAARQQALALVVADRVDRDPGPLRQLVDAPVAHVGILKAGESSGVEHESNITGGHHVRSFDKPTPE